MHDGGDGQAAPGLGGGGTSGTALRPPPPHLQPTVVSVLAPGPAAQNAGAALDVGTRRWRRAHSVHMTRDERRAARAAQRVEKATAGTHGIHAACREPGFENATNCKRDEL